MTGYGSEYFRTLQDREANKDEKFIQPYKSILKSSGIEDTLVHVSLSLSLFFFLFVNSIIMEAWIELFTFIMVIGVTSTASMLGFASLSKFLYYIYLS